MAKVADRDWIAAAAPIGRSHVSHRRRDAARGRPKHPSLVETSRRADVPHALEPALPLRGGRQRKFAAHKSVGAGNILVDHIVDAIRLCGGHDAPTEPKLAGRALESSHRIVRDCGRRRKREDNAHGDHLIHLHIVFSSSRLLISIHDYGPWRNLPESARCMVLSGGPAVKRGRGGVCRATARGIGEGAASPSGRKGARPSHCVH